MREEAQTASVGEVMSDDKKDLTDKQKQFVLEYLIDRNATQAAIRAGYSVDSAKQIAHQLMQKEEIHSAIQEQLKARSERTLIDGDYVLMVAKEMIDRCRQAEPVLEWDPDAKEYVKTGEWKFEHSGVGKGLDVIMKLQGLGAPTKVDLNMKGEVDHNVSGTLKVDLDERIDQLKQGAPKPEGE